MRIWKKFLLFTITIISVVLSCSRYYIVKNNFLHSIENISKQNINQHSIEKYLLESKIVNNIQSGEEVTDEKIIEYLNSLYNYMENNSELVAIYTEDYKQLYSNIDNIDSLDVKTLLEQETNLYCIRRLNNNHYMLFSSQWKINNKMLYIINAYNINAIYEEKDRQITEILMIDIIILVIASIIIFIFSKYLTNPIQRLNKTSKKIAAGKFNERVHIKSKDEIGELSQSFNRMAEEIENKINELNMQVKQKNDFINAFTHELKTPMTAMMGYADLLRLKKCDEEVSKKAIQYIYSETKRLESLSFKLMQLMSLTDDKIKMNPFEIKDFLYKIVKVESNLLGNIQIELNAQPGVVIGDSELLEVVIRNLIENAKNAEPKDYKILIKGEKTNNKKYKISIIDKGKGIPQEHITRVTEDFYMVDKSRSKNEGGSGIGLSLVKKILILHKSDIHIESEENVGTRVFFELEEGK